MGLCFVVVSVEGVGVCLVDFLEFHCLVVEDRSSVLKVVVLDC
jgi:hypothetical protein